MGKFQKVLAFILISTVLTACSYRFGYAYRKLPGSYDQVAIPVFKNDTSQVAVEPYFTNALIEEFERSKIAQVVPKARAPVILNGSIKQISFVRDAYVKGTFKKGSAPTSSEVARLPKNTAIATSIRIYVTSDLVLVRASDQRELWRGSFQNEIVYSAPRIGTEIVNSANANYNDSAFKQKISELAQVMMEEAHDRVTENF